MDMADGVRCTSTFGRVVVSESDILKSEIEFDSESESESEGELDCVAESKSEVGTVVTSKSGLDCEFVSKSGLGTVAKSKSGLDCEFVSKSGLGTVAKSKSGLDCEVVSKLECVAEDVLTSVWSKEESLLLTRIQRLMYGEDQLTR